MILTKVNEIMYARTLVFVSVITIVQSLPFIWVLIQTCFVGVPLLDVGPADFLIYGFYSFLVCIFEFSYILSYGSEANALDTKIKEYLLNFTQECSDSRHLALQEQVWEKDGQIYIFEKVEGKEEWWCFNDNKIYYSL